MGKDPNFIGQPIFSQLLSFIDKREVDEIASQYKADRYTKKLTTHGHLVTMLYGIFHRCSSIREVTTGMQACFTKLNHVGMTYCPRRSTLSDANRSRSQEVFEGIYKALFRKYSPTLSDSRNEKELLSKLYIVDSTTISLFKEILKNAGRTPADGKRKGGMKVHALIRADQDVPCLVKMTAAAKHDVPFIKKMKLPKGSIVTFDKGYRSYDQYQMWSDEGVTWVTRLTEKSKFEIADDMPLTIDQRSAGIISDQLITLGHTTHKQVTRVAARLITYYDAGKEKFFSFITNNIILEAETVCLIYRKRWQIELLFKRLKQNYPLQNFLGDNENALKVQVWCALIADLIIKVIKSKVKRNWSNANLISMVRLHLMSYFNLIKFLNDPDKTLINLRTLEPSTPNLFNSE